MKQLWESVESEKTSGGRVEVDSERVASEGDEVVLEDGDNIARGDCDTTVEEPCFFGYDQGTKTCWRSTPGAPMEEWVVEMCKPPWCRRYVSCT